LESGLQVVTLLTTDAVSSTEQQLRLGDHRGDELRRERDDLVAREIERSRGVVIKSTGDGTFAAFASPSEALSCAVAVQRSVARRNLAATERVEIRVGLATGEVVAEGGDVFGRAAIESTRITAQAGAGEILCCGLTRQLAAPRSTCPIESAGEAVLKGFATPVPVFRVGWAEVFEPVVPLPAAIAGRRQPFVGRSSVLAAASELWMKTTSTQRPHVLILGGEPGVGKTCALSRLADNVFRTGATVLYGRCTENDIDSLRPIREALAQYVAARHDSLADELGSGRNELVRLAPELEEVAGVPDAQASDHRAATAALFDAVAQWLGAASRVRPILFLIDDAEWLDAQTAKLLRRLAEESDVGPLLIAIAHRDREPLATGELVKLVTLLRSTASSAETMRLTGLSSEESAELVGLVQPSHSDRSKRLHVDSGGNPLYLLELLRAVEPVHDRASLEGGPNDATELVLRRVDRLPPEFVSVLEAGAVLGQSFDVTSIERMLGWPTDDTYRTLDGLVRNELLHETTSTDVRFEFAHAVVRDAVYARLTKVRRIGHHRKAADSLEALAATGRPVPPRDIARHHLAAAPSRSVEPALGWCRRAARDATDRLAYEEAGRWLESGLELFGQLHPRPNADYFELVLERAVASQRAGERGTRDRFLHAAEIAQSLGDAQGLVRVALAFDRGFFATLGRADQRRIQILREAISLASDSPKDRACLLALLASELTWDDPDGARFAFSEEALEIARAAGDHATLLRVLSLRPPTIWALDTYNDVLASVDELGELTRKDSDPVLEGRYLTFRFGAAAEGGEFRSLPGVVDRLGELAWFLRLPDALWHATLLRANLALLDGRLSEARTLATESLEWGRRARQPEAMMFYAAVELEVRRLCGGLDEMIPQLELARGTAANGGYSATRFLYDAGHANAAREDYARAVRGPRTMPNTINGGPTVANLAYLAARFEDIPRADHFLQLLEPYSGRFFQGITTYHVAEHYRGILAATAGRFGQAAELLRTATDLHDKVGAPLLAAESRLEWARLALLDQQWSEPAPHALVDSAIAAAEASGAAVLVQRAHALRSRL
jgi:class 3 adenylate cyclase